LDEGQRTDWSHSNSHLLRNNRTTHTMIYHGLSMVILSLMMNVASAKPDRFAKRDSGCAPNCAICDSMGAELCDPGQCDAGYAATTDNTCGACAAGCSACTNSGPGNCDACLSGTGPPDGVAGSCVICADPHCAQCLANSAVCQTCIFGYAVTSDGTCQEMEY
jgi:hypothetical protein